MKNKKIMIVGVVVSTLLLLGFFLPLGSYTTTAGCPTGTDVPTKRLHLITGGTIQKIKNSDVQLPNAGCSINTKYVLYFF